MVVRWEYWTVANMLISTHGELAEIRADEQVANARAAGNTGDEVAWREIAKQVEKIRASRGIPG